MQGRPHAADSRARHASFLELVAAGASYFEASKAARLSANKALRIVSEPTFADVVLAIREGTEVAA
jgi:hypothetical protein